MSTTPRRKCDGVAEAGEQDALSQHATSEVLAVPLGGRHRAGARREIIIARNGRPAAKLVPMETSPGGKRIGVAKGKFDVPDSIDTHNAEVARMFLGEQS